MPKKTKLSELPKEDVILIFAQGTQQHHFKEGVIAFFDDNESKVESHFLSFIDRNSNKNFSAWLDGYHYAEVQIEKAKTATLMNIDRLFHVANRYTAG